MKFLKKAKCLFKGHKFVPAQSFMLPARKCTCCELEQLQMPGVGCLNPNQWVNISNKKVEM